MKPVLMSLDSLQQRSNLAPTPPFVPARKPRTQVQTKHSRLRARRNDFEKGVTRSCRVVPLVIRNFLSTKKPDRMVPSRGPERKSRRRRQSFNHFRTRRFLKDDKIRRRRFDHFRQRLFAAHSTKSDVIAE